MKFRFAAWGMVSVAFLGAMACQEKPKVSEEAGAEGKGKAVVESVVEEVEEAVSSGDSTGLDVTERAAKLGFARYLPKDTEMLVSVYNAEQAASQLKALQLYKVLEGGAGLGQATDALPPESGEDMLEDEKMAPDAEQDPEDDIPPMEEGAGGPDAWTLLGREITLGIGKSAGEQAGHLLTLNRRMAYFQARTMGQALQEFAKSGNAEDFSNRFMSGMQGGGVLASILEDPESGTGLIEKAVMPPLTIAFRANEGELEQAAQLVAGSMAFFGMAGEMAEPFKAETAGSVFTGYKLVGEKIAATLEAGREGMEKNYSPEIVDALIGAVGRKNLFIVSGTLGEYVVVMISGTEDSLSLVTKVEDSIIGEDGLAFIDPFADKQLLSVAHGDQEMLKILLEEAGGLGTYATGLRDGIAGGGGLGETRDLEEMLQLIADREKEMLSLGSSAAWDMVAYTEDGLKIESFGGNDRGAIDWDAGTTLSHLNGSGDNLLFLNLAAKADYNEKMSEYVEAIFGTAYAVSMKLSAIETEVPGLEDVKKYMRIFDEGFREDLVGLYGALSGELAEGLGSERAIVVDLAGPVPALPGIPKEVLEQGKGPRITVISPVIDREKLSSAWSQVDIRATSLLAKVGKLSGEELPAMKPMASESEGMKTWFYPLPFFEEDFMPSVTVSDKWFAASTSKIQMVDLMRKAAAGGEAGKGILLHINLAALAQYADETLVMLDRNSAAIFPNEYDLKEFNRKKGDIRKSIDALREFDSLKWTSRKENGTVHSVVHFKTK